MSMAAFLIPSLDSQWVVFGTYTLVFFECHVDIITLNLNFDFFSELKTLQIYPVLVCFFLLRSANVEWMYLNIDGLFVCLLGYF